MADDVLTEAEIRKLIQALAAHGKPFTEEETMAVLEWAARIRMEYAMLNLALQSRVTLVVRENGEVAAQKG